MPFTEHDMNFTDAIFLALLPSGLIPIFLMYRHGQKLPSTRGDKKDRNPVNRHLRFVDARVRVQIGKKGIFVTEVYSAITHAVEPIGVLLFLKCSSFGHEAPPLVMRAGEIGMLLLMLGCVLNYGFVAWCRYRRAS